MHVALVNTVTLLSLAQAEGTAPELPEPTFAPALPVSLTVEGAIILALQLRRVELAAALIESMTAARREELTDLAAIVSRIVVDVQAGRPLGAVIERARRFSELLWSPDA